MEQRPQQPPEGRLIADATERMGLSIREASRRAGISYGRWRQITSGVQHVSPGNYAAVRAPAKTVAKMAAVVHVSPAEMEAEGQRPDVAAIMRERKAPLPLGAEEFARSFGVDPLNPLDPFIRDVNDEIERAEEIYGEDVTGIQIFHGGPAGQVEALVYDAPGVSREAKVAAIATLRASRARESARPDRRNAGLIPLLTLAGR